MANKQSSKIHRLVDEGENVAQDVAQDAAQAGIEAGREAEVQARRQAERMQQAQERLLSIYSSFMTHWLQRRQTAAQATMDAAQRAFATGGQPAKLPEIYNEWLNGSFERIAADIREYQECSGEIVAVMQDSLPLGEFRAGAVSERVS